MTGVRHCRFCHRKLVGLVRRPDETEEHCPSPNCHWCMPCDRAKRDEGKTTLP